MTRSIPPSRRWLFVSIILATLVGWSIVIVDLARGGRADPPALRAAATLLDGDWRFRTGDDARWSDPYLDDSGWETIDLTATPGSHDGDVGLPDYVGGWMAHGHPGYTGYAWYRRAIEVPATPPAWDILGPTLVEDGYELYWNGRLLGGSGRLGEHPRVVGTRPLQFALPADAAGTRGVLSLRVFELSRAQPSASGGGMHSPPILAPRAVADGLHRAQWNRTVAGYVVDAIEPLAMFLLVGLALGCSLRSRYRGFLVVASIALALTALRRLDNALVSWTDLIDLPTYSFMARYLWPPTVAAWALAWNRWHPRPSRLVDALALALMAAAIAGAVAHGPNVTHASRLAFIALFAVIGMRIVRGGRLRALALATLALITVSFFGELLDPLGVPGIWFPFGIGVSRTQYLYAALIPLLALLIAWTSGDRRTGESLGPTPDPSIRRALSLADSNE